MTASRIARHVLRLAPLAALGSTLFVPAALAAAPRPAAARAIVAEEHWALKGDVRLYLYRKQQAGTGQRRPVLLLVHGSSFSGRGGFDLHVPGRPGYSMMDHFAGRGFDVWTLDHEGYGRSTRTAGNADVATGAADLEAAYAIIRRVTGSAKVMIYAQSGGALRAGVFAMRWPDRVDRLILDGFTWTGDGAPEIMRRRANVETYRRNTHRTADLAMFTNIFSRDDPSTVDPAVPKALAKYELALGNRVPNGTYLDMASRLPMIEPARLTMPVLLLRAETDGNATDRELVAFFEALPNKDKQLAFVSGVAHVSVLGINRNRVFHVFEEFLTMPPAQGAGRAAQ